MDGELKTYLLKWLELRLSYWKGVERRETADGSKVSTYCKAKLEAFGDVIDYVKAMPDF